AALGLANFARGRRAVGSPTSDDPQQQQLETASRVPGGLEARLAGVVVAALKEAFDRDTRRLDLERQQLEAERQRAERALRLELQRRRPRRTGGRVALPAWRHRGVVHLAIPNRGGDRRAGGRRRSAVDSRR